ncbi:MAG: DUF1018 domain-containing protein [Sphaerochaetaceae bacterium]|nr:DUF1018 domain-containing protein [Sphaerochaetaceae bacterium]
MTPAQEKYRKSLIKKIQVNKRNVFYDEDERREFMQSRFGAESLKDMSIDQLNLFLDFCLRKVNDIPMLHTVEGKALITQAQVEKIRTVWKEKAKDKSEKALLVFASRVSGHRLERLEDLLKGKATKVIVALERMV